MTDTNDSIFLSLKEENATPPDPNHPNCFGNFKQYGWADAFYNKDIEAFTKVFDPGVTQSASASPLITFGVAEVADNFQWASDFYIRCDFTHQAAADHLEFLEWDLTTVNNMHITGMTVLTKDTDGKVVKVFNGHRNLTETLIFTEHFVKGPKDKGTVSLFHNKARKKYGLEHKYPRNPVGFNGVASVTATDYVDAFRSASEAAFLEIFDSSVTLSGSHVAEVIPGAGNVAKTLELMSTFYEHCTFTAQASYENRTYLLYNGRLRNGLLVSDGFLILVRNDSGKIIQVFDNPIPMHAGTLISEYVAKHHPDRAFADRYFYSDKLFMRSVEKYSLDNVYGKNTKDLSSIKGFIAKFFLPV